MVLVFGFNVIINPYGMYGTKWLNPIVWSDRREKLDLLGNYPGRVELLILGSSRTMRLDPEIFQSLTGLESFNLSVNHARAEDFLALVRYVVSKTVVQKPLVVVVGLDINAFRGYYQMDNLLKYYPELFYFLEKEKSIGLTDDLAVGWNKFVKGMSYHQFVQSFQAFRRYLIKGPWQNAYRFSSNGLLTYNRAEDDTVVGDSLRLREVLNLRIKQLRERFISFGGLSPERKHYFEELIDFCLRNEIELIAVVLPDHPQVVKALAGTAFERLNHSFKNYLIGLTARYGVNMVDASSLESFAGDPHAFYDDIHMMSSNSELLVRYIIRAANLGGRDSF